MFIAAGFKAGAEHLLFDAAVLQEVDFDEVDQLVEHDYGLVEEGEHEVAELLVAKPWGELHVESGVVVVAAGLAQLFGAGMVNAPAGDVAGAHKVLVIIQQLVEAAARHTIEPDLHLGGCGGIGAPLGDVLLARAGSLQHLIVGAIRLGNMPLEEEICEIVDCLRLAESVEIAVAGLGPGKIVGWHSGCFFLGGGIIIGLYWAKIANKWGLANFYLK